MLTQLLLLLEQYDASMTMSHFYSTTRKIKEAAVFAKDEDRLSKELEGKGVKVLVVDKDYFVIEVSRHAKGPAKG